MTMKTGLIDKDITTQELDFLALKAKHCYSISPCGDNVFSWHVHRPGRAGQSGPAFSLEEAIEKVKDAMTAMSGPVYCNNCGSNDIARDVKLINVEVWDAATEQWVHDYDEDDDIAHYHCRNCDSDNDVTDENEGVTGKPRRGLLDPDPPGDTPRKPKRPGPFDGIFNSKGGR